MIFSAVFSTDGRFVLTGSQDFTACLWETVSGRQLRCFTRHTDKVTSVAFSPDAGLVLTGSYDHTVVLWETASGRAVREYDLKYAVSSVAFSPDDRFIMGGNRAGTVYLWDAKTGVELRRLEAKEPINAIAFSPDSRFLMMNDVMCDVQTGVEVRKFTPNPDWVALAVAFSPDGKLVVTGGYNHVAIVWETATGKQILKVPEIRIWSVAISPDATLLATASRGQDVAHVWEIASGKEVWEIKHKNAVDSIRFSPDGGSILTGCWDNVARLWDLRQRALTRSFGGTIGFINSVAVSSDGRFIATSDEIGKVHVWDIRSGAEAWRAEASAWEQRRTNNIWSIAFSPNGRFLATAGDDHTSRVYDAATGQELQRFQHPDVVRAVTFSNDGKTVVTGCQDTRIYFWDTATGVGIRQFKRFAMAWSLSYSPDGRYLAAGASAGYTYLMDAATLAELSIFKADAFAISATVFTKDSRFLLTNSTHLTGGDKSAHLWEVATGKDAVRFEGHLGSINSVAISPDQRFALTGSIDYSARLWDLATGKEIRRFEHSSDVHSVAFSADGRFIVTGCQDGATYLWNTATGQELCRLISFTGETWTVVDTEGRFDTNNLDDNPGLRWIMPDEPMKPLPIEIFTRDYYEPGLLARVLRGDELTPVASLATLNRVQPCVEIMNVASQAGSPDLVTVTIAVAKAASTVQRDASGKFLETGVYSLQLFRNGQLVGQLPTAQGADDIASWRRNSGVELDDQARRIVEFKDIKLPRHGSRETEFSAYAFNEDRVKSATARKVFNRPEMLVAAKGRAYVITVGVSAYENRAWDLKFAAKDARLARRVLSTTLLQTRQFSEVVPISLISDYPAAGRRMLESTATKANVKEALELLSGAITSPTLLRKVANSAKLRKATPDDLVLIFFSSHGLYRRVGGRDNFYFLPSDIGSGDKMLESPDLFAHSISNEEFADWLKDVDAGELIVIANACQSEASINTAGFKPGPLGNRSLGQLAYDKGMRILAASQSLASALEADELSASLLTRALISEGLQAKRADNSPTDQKIMLGEWLKYGATRVPALYAAANYPEARVQRPVLFDFVRNKRDIALAEFAARLPPARSTNLKKRRLHQRSAH
jgi:WD40 repeat protein